MSKGSPRTACRACCAAPHLTSFSWMSSSTLSFFTLTYASILPRSGGSEQHPAQTPHPVRPRVVPGALTCVDGRFCAWLGPWCKPKGLGMVLTVALDLLRVSGSFQRRLEWYTRFPGAAAAVPGCLERPSLEICGRA